MSDKITVKAISPIRYGTADDEVKNYEPGDTFEVSETEAKQLAESGAVELTDTLAKQLEDVPTADPDYIAAEDLPQTERTAAPEATAPEAPLVQNVPTPTPATSQPTAQDISETLDSLK